MINKILARNFRGQTFDQELGPYNLFIGPNGAGKSSRTQALTLAIMGYLPSDQDKQPSAIYQTHGNGKEMTVAFEKDGDRFSRNYKPGPDGGATLSVKMNGKKISQKLVDRVLIDLGDPKIFDLVSFNALSEVKKIDLILHLFPPSGDLKAIDRKLEGIEEREKSLRENIKAAGQVVTRLTGERAAIELPSGTLAGIQAEIKSKDWALVTAQEELKKAELEEAERVADEKREREVARAVECLNKLGEETKEREKFAAEEAEANAEEARKRVRRALEKTDEFAKKERETLDKLEEKGKELTAEREKNREAIAEKKWPIVGVNDKAHHLTSLEKIKETLEKAECTACASMIVVKAEIRRLKHGHD